jgi:uncharacterized protein (TIGR02246 family)
MTTVPSVGAQAGSRDSTDVHAALRQFLRAFEDLDWERFRASFADDATVFFPTPEPPQRFTGRDAVEAQFRRVFEAIRRATPAGPPFQQLAPVDLRIIVLGPSSALATFELHNAARIGRRTVVFRREDGRWRITHLHASNVAVAGAAPPGI